MCFLSSDYKTKMKARSDQDSENFFGSDLDPHPCPIISSRSCSIAHAPYCSFPTIGPLPPGTADLLLEVLRAQQEVPLLRAQELRRAGHPGAHPPLPE